MKKYLLSPLSFCLFSLAVALSTHSRRMSPAFLPSHVLARFGVKRAAVISSAING